MSSYKVIFHIDEIDKWKLLLGNVKNLIEAVGDEKFNIEVLANSEAVKAYIGDETLEVNVTLMEKLHHKGVKFVVCNNALKANEINVEQLFNFIHIVPAGVLELIEKQGEGYAYIKP